MVKNLPASAAEVRDAGSIPGWGRSPGGRHSNPLQYSCLENPLDRRAWQATARRVAKRSDTSEAASTCTLEQVEDKGGSLQGCCPGVGMKVISDVPL